MIAAPDPPELTGRQRKYLRGKAHSLDAVVWVGHDGISEGVLRAVNEALTTHELIKVRLREPEDKHGDATRLADGTKSVLCGVLGHTVVLYRPHPDRPRIVLE